MKLNWHPLRGWASGFREYGWLLALAVAIAALAFSAYVANPVEETEQRVAGPAARSLGLIEGKCPSGWKSHDLDGADGADARARTCTQDPWVVTLNTDGSFSHAINTGDPNAEVVSVPEGVPGWLD